jgi:hypothetical protein
MTGREDRRTPRLPVVTFAWYCVIGDCNPESSPCEGIARTINLSAEGVGLYTPHPVTPGTYIFIELTTSTGAISLVGQAPYARKLSDDYYQVGVSIKIIPPNDRGAFEAMLKRALHQSQSDPE